MQPPVEGRATNPTHLEEEEEEASKLLELCSELMYLCTHININSLHTRASKHFKMKPFMHVQIVWPVRVDFAKPRNGWQDVLMSVNFKY